MAKHTLSAVLGLLTGALVWGLIWYPYRALESHGMPGVHATLITYALALGLALTLFRRQLATQLRIDAILVLIALAAGWTNLAYVLGMLDGEVMQVLLLFYLAPLWTLLFARLLLGERPGLSGLLIILLSLGGAAAMLWEPGLRIPVPHTRAEWFGLTAGMAFALSNVLIRRARHHPLQVKSTAAFAGVTALALAMLPFAASVQVEWRELAGHGTLWLLPLIGVVLLATNVVVQHGLNELSANQAIVILLSELVVAALSAFVLAGESMRWNEWAGGALIVTATLLSGRLTHDEAG